MRARAVAQLLFAWWARLQSAQLRFSFAMRARAVRAAAFHLAMRWAKVRAVVFQPAMRAGVAVRAAVLLCHAGRGCSPHLYFSLPCGQGLQSTQSVSPCRAGTGYTLCSALLPTMVTPLASCHRPRGRAPRARARERASSLPRKARVVAFFEASPCRVRLSASRVVSLFRHRRRFIHRRPHSGRARWAGPTRPGTPRPRGPGQASGRRVRFARPRQPRRGRGPRSRRRTSSPRSRGKRCSSRSCVPPARRCPCPRSSSPCGTSATYREQPAGGVLAPHPGGPARPAVRATPAAGGGLRVTSGDAAGDGENAAHHLLLIERRLHLVVSQSGGKSVNASSPSERTPCVLQLRPKLQGPHQGPIRSFGYVGAFVAELAALQELALRGARGGRLARAARDARPREAVAGHWHPPPLPEEDFARIAASRGAVRKGAAFRAEASSARATPSVAGAESDEEDEETLRTPPVWAASAPASAARGGALCVTRSRRSRARPGRARARPSTTSSRIASRAREVPTCRATSPSSIAQKLRACGRDAGGGARSYRRDGEEAPTGCQDRVAPEGARGCRDVAGRLPERSSGGERPRDLMSRCRLILCTIASTSRLLREWEEFAPRTPWTCTP